jgi:hypothetical protein
VCRRPKHVLVTRLCSLLLSVEPTRGFLDVTRWFKQSCRHVTPVQNKRRRGMTIADTLSTARDSCVRVVVPKIYPQSIAENFQAYHDQTSIPTASPDCTIYVKITRCCLQFMFEARHDSTPMRNADLRDCSTYLTQHRSLCSSVRPHDAVSSSCSKHSTTRLNAHAQRGSSRLLYISRNIDRA